MKNRCDNPNTHQYKDYGGRGITYCAEWSKFDAFFNDMGEPPEKMTLDRIDNNGNYEPSNCRWTSRVTQRLNSRCHTRYVEINGETLILKDAVQKYGVMSYGNVCSRIHRGWTDLDAILTPATRLAKKA